MGTGERRPRPRHCSVAPSSAACCPERHAPNRRRALPALLQEAAAAARVEQVSGAMTNLVYRCTSPAAAANATVIVRVFGTGGKLFSQKDERNIFLLASDLGLGPKCLVRSGCLMLAGAGRHLAISHTGW